MKRIVSTALSIILAMLFVMVASGNTTSAAPLPPPGDVSIRNVSFNRTAAVNWAQANNYNNGAFYGSSHGRWCTTLIANAWAEGGLPDVPRTWIGNQQIVWWMQAHPDYWEFRPISQLVGGDIILYSDNADAIGNWSYTNGWSLWQHVALVNSTNQVTAWNAEYRSIGATAFSGLPYRLGVHIRTDESTGGPTGASHQGTLSYGVTQRRALTGDPSNPSIAGHRWVFYAQPSYNQLLVDIQHVSGTLTGDLVLTDAGGNVLVTTRTSTTGRGIVLYNTPSAQDLYIHFYADDQTSGEYDITVWSTSIPKIQYEWNWQDSHSHVTHWRGPVGTNATFYFIIERLSGNYEYNWRLENDGGGQLSSGSSTNGAAIIPGYGSGMMHVKLTPTSGSGSYRIGLRSGDPVPAVPTITGLSNGSNVGRNFALSLIPGAHDQEGGAQYQVQIDNDPGFGSPAFDSGWSASPNMQVNGAIPAGAYYVRARQGNTTGEVSPYTPVLTIIVTNIVKSGEVLLNRGFENGGAGLITSWKVLTPTFDGRKCNKPGKVVSHSGECAFKYTGGTQAVILKQSALSDALPGDSLTLTGWVATNNLNGTNKVVVTVTYNTGIETNMSVTLPSGTMNWTNFSQSMILNTVAKRIVLKVKGQGTSGSFSLDDLSLIISSSARQADDVPTLPLPAQPNSFRGSN